MTSDHDHGLPPEHEPTSHGHPDHVHDAACEFAHGTVQAPADGRMMVAVFATPVAHYLLRYAADSGYQPVLVEPDTQLAKEASEAGFDVRPGVASVPGASADDRPSPGGTGRHAA